MGYIICLVAPGGSGKSTIAREMAARYGFMPSKIHTNRPIRLSNDAGNMEMMSDFTAFHATFEDPFSDGEPSDIVWKFKTDYMYDNMQKTIYYWHMFDYRVISTDYIYLMESINPDMLKAMIYHYGSEVVIPIYLQRDRELCIRTLIERERTKSEQHKCYEEVIRRVNQDAAHFAINKMVRLCKYCVGVEPDISDTMESISKVLRDIFVPRIDNINKKYISTIWGGKA